jgi:DNA-binding NarL/FixJ family response regulator
VVVIPASNGTSAKFASSNHVTSLLIDRQPLFLAALGSLMAAPPISAHVLSALRSDVGLEMIRTEQVDIVFCELQAQPVPGVELIRVLSDEDRHIPVVLLGDDGDEPHLAAALATGAAGLFTKSADPDEFMSGVRAIISGHRAIGSHLVGSLLERAPLRHHPHESDRFANQLSPTELEILSMIGRAQSIPAIAASRGISHKTVRNHLAKIYRKLELHGRTEAMLWAARMGLTGS